MVPGRLRSMLASAVVVMAAACVPRDDARATAHTELAALHERLLEAHRQRDVEPWMALEADSFVSANGGGITFPTVAERRSGREAYFRSTTFDVYRDVVPPIIEVSADGTMGWVIAQVEVAGSQVAADSSRERFDIVWAWIELYRRIDGEWKLVGNVSNRRQ